ncbi:MAG: hypothetical protein FVQ77_02290 [Cytophagales bacterium]|nr:hypothetical protein [Cytophagales bacterium]
MRTILLLFFVLISSVCTYAQQYQWGIGIRLGDPTGITVKKYISEGNAFELNIGSTGFWDFNRTKKCGFKASYDDYEFLGHDRSSVLAIQFHYLFHNNISGIDVGILQWYFGFGAQVRFFGVCNYRYKPFDGSPWIHDQVSEIDIGGDGVIGAEYTFEGVPISVFLDLCLFLEIVDNPFLFFGQGGLGARYNF